MKKLILLALVLLFLSVPLVSYANSVPDSDSHYAYASNESELSNASANADLDSATEPEASFTSTQAESKSLNRTSSLISAPNTDIISQNDGETPKSVRKFFSALAVVIFGLCLVSAIGLLFMKNTK